MIPFEDIDKRLDLLGLDRKWLAAASDRSPDSIRTALAPNASASKRSNLLQRALSDAIEREEAKRQSQVVLPERISIEASREEFDAWCRAYKASDHDTLQDWSVAALNRVAEQWHAEQARQTAEEEARQRRGKLKVAEDPPVYGKKYWTDLHGGIAAGAPISSQVVAEPIEVPKEYPADHYALRVFGRSMEPKIPDGSIIIVREFHDQGYPKQGTIVVYSDRAGSTLKEFGYRKAERGEEANAFGKVPVLRSINKAFPDVETMDGGRIDAVFVEVL